MKYVIRFIYLFMIVLLLFLNYINFIIFCLIPCLTILIIYLYFSLSLYLKRKHLDFYNDNIVYKKSGFRLINLNTVYKKEIISISKKVTIKVYNLRMVISFFIISFFTPVLLIVFKLVK